QGRRPPEGGRFRDCWKEGPRLGGRGRFGGQAEENATGMPANESPHANPCRPLTQFDLRRPEGAECAGSQPWGTLGLPGTGFLRVVQEVPPRLSRGLRIRGAWWRAVLWMSRHRSCFPVSPAREEIAAGADADALPTDREPRHYRQHAQ